MPTLFLAWLAAGCLACGAAPTGPATSANPAATPDTSATSTGTRIAATVVRECDAPRSEWIWCDDFERDRLVSYFEHNRAEGDFDRVESVGLEGSHGMRTRFRAGREGHGWMHVAFGRTPQSYMRPVDDGVVVHRDVYWRFFVRNQEGWTGGGGHKLTRARGFASAQSWQQSMAAPVWSEGQAADQDFLMLDPVSGTDESGTLLPYQEGNLGENPRWLGAKRGTTPLFDASHVGRWYCVEAHARLNDPGLSDGVFEFWIDGGLEARRESLNWVGSFVEYGINTISLDNYWNGGAPQDQERYLDNFVVSTERIGCGD